MKLKLVLFAALCLNSIFIPTHGMEKTTIEKHQEFLAQQKEPSNFMRWVHKIAGKYVLPDFPAKPASSFHNQMWKKAQNDLNIPEQYHALIVAFDSEKNNLITGGSNKFLTHARMSYKMYINQEHCGLEDSPYSRFMHYHEAVHHKYLDPFKANLLGIPLAFLTGCIAFPLVFYPSEHVLKKNR